MDPFQREVIERLTELRGHVVEARADIAEVKMSHGEHEKRIRAIERVQWSLAGISTMFGGAITALANWLLHR